MGWMLQGRSRESYFSEMLFNSKCTLNKPNFSPSPRKAAQTESSPAHWLQYLLPGTGKELSVPPARTVQVPALICPFQPSSDAWMWPLPLRITPKRTFSSKAHLVSFLRVSLQSFCNRQLSLDQTKMQLLIKCLSVCVCIYLCIKCQEKSNPLLSLLCT